MNDKLAIQPKVLFNPEKDTDKAKRAADRLVDIVRQNHWAVKVRNGEHLMFEAWQTLGKYYNHTVATGEVEPVELNSVPGFKAKAWVIDNRTGIRVGEAEAYCMRDEPNWKSKPVFQLASMAQTRAGSKALRQIFSFVVALAGFNPTPAEEMTGEERHAVDPVKQEKTRTIPATDKQKGWIKGLLLDKGFTREDMEKKYGSIDELSIADASKIINNLTQLPDNKEEEIDVDAVDKAISEQ